MIVYAAASPDLPTDALWALVESPVQGMAVHRRFEPLFVSPGFRALFGLPADGAPPEAAAFLALWDCETRADPEAAWRAQSAPIGVIGRRSWRRANGSEAAVMLRARPILWRGEPAVAVAVVDVSGEEEARRALDAALARATAVSQAQQHFLAAASHELRTPLHAMLGRLQLLNAAMLPDMTRTLATDALAACRRLLHHVDDVLDTAMAQRGPIPLSYEPFEIGAALQAALDVVRDATDLSDARVLFGGDVRARFMGDERRVRRIAVALLEEALRRNPPGAVIVEARAALEGLRIAVRAPGAPSLEPDGAEPRAFASMPIARTLAQAMGGTLSETSEAGLGWQATATLPLGPAAEQQAAFAAGLEILVVEDNRGNRALLEQVLIALGHRPHLAESGFEGVAMAQERPFDLVLMDLSMPSMDGFEAARRIRAMDRPWADLPIAALTASAGPGVQRAAAEAGMDAFLQKPVEIAQLAEMVALLTRPRIDSVDAAELNQVQQKDDQHKAADQHQSSHARPQEARVM